FLENLGAHRRFMFITQLFLKEKSDKNVLRNKETIMPVVLACLAMSKRTEGALIVIERFDSLQEVMKTGERIDAIISQQLIENIFFKNSPLHDGAMIISKRRIHSAGCILPVSHDLNIPKELGLR
ncbi:DNA integrity scanning protein DisA nucleotide-binding domain protein, partial [Parabacteroides distasonis]